MRPTSWAGGGAAGRCRGRDRWARATRQEPDTAGEAGRGRHGTTGTARAWRGRHGTTGVARARHDVGTADTCAGGTAGEAGRGRPPRARARPGVVDAADAGESAGKVAGAGAGGGGDALVRVTREKGRDGPYIR